MSDAQKVGRELARNRVRFLDQAMDGVLKDALKQKKEQQLDYLRQMLPQLCAAAHFIDETSEVDLLIEAWNAAEAVDRITPAEAVVPDTHSTFNTIAIMERVLQRSIGLVRSLPLHRAHKPMFKPYVHEITAVSANCSPFFVSRAIFILRFKGFLSRVTSPIPVRPPR